MAYAHGARSMTHVYNGMTAFNHRANGLVGAAYRIRTMYGEIICDGNHSTPAALNNYFMSKGPDYCIMISDALMAKGTPIGSKFMFGGNEIVIYPDGSAHLTSTGKLAGSTLKLNQGLRILVEEAMVPFNYAINSCTINPARCIGVDDRKGMIKVGMDADIVVLDADLAGATKTGVFKKAFPERHIDCGIAEGNMMGVAAGLATCGKIPFASSFAMFAAGRAFEQVRNSIGYPHLNVKIGATHAGISVGEDGATHQCNEDIAIMRTIPGMTIICPADDVEARAAVKAAAEYVGPVYMRFGRLAVPVINDEANYKFEIGKGITLKEGKDVTIIATGLEVNESLEAAKLLEADGISAEVINIHTIKPLDKELVVASAKKTGKVVTVEEHSVIGGLGGAVAEALSEEAPTKMLRIGMMDKFGQSGPAKALIEYYGLDGKSIYEKVKAFL